VIIEPPGPATLLFVDDEPNMLSALRRLFRPLGHQVLLTGSGAEALELLQSRSVDVLVTDMRMPAMSGAELLAQVAERWPSTMRILLTGYTDMDSAIAAINSGHIYGYYTKPWEEAELRLGVVNALREKRLEEERQRLLEELEARNRELSELNTSLDGKVQVRTAQLQTALLNINTAHRQLKRNYTDTVRAFAQLVELREGRISGHARRVAELGRGIAMRLELSGQQIQDIVLAGLLLQVGKVTLPDKILAHPVNALWKPERQRLYHHAAVGAAVLENIDPLRSAAHLIARQFECYDGSGFPAGLSGEQIPLGARILAPVRDYDLMLEGAMSGKPITTSEAQDQLRRLRGKKYDPLVVDTLIGLVGEVYDTLYRPVIEASLLDLVPGMEVVEVSADGKTLLREVVLTEEMIQEIEEHTRDAEGPLEIRVRARK
jgi:response regulator RpfG family c-di-GMP phosphodiesterase